MMELRASSDVGMAEDITPPLLPLAAALHHHFLNAHCSSCFLPITPNPQTQPNPSPLCLSCCPASLRYCSTACLRSDTTCHLSSGECQLLHHLLNDEDTTTDLRVALRLLHSFEKSGLLYLPRRHGRVGGLLAMARSSVGEDWDMARKVKEGGEVMASVRGNVGGGEVEEAMLWVVMLNGVEVMRIEGGGGALGTAVYGPMFSWFNHSCSPNACYRFEMGWLEGNVDGVSGFGVYPHGDGEGEAAVLKSWIDDESKLNQELCRFGPRIIVRSSKPIRKNEEVCITYTDLIQPKALRHLDLWEKYHFVCCCCRCTASPENSVDRMLSESAADYIDKNLCAYDHNQDEAWQEVADTLDDAIAEFISVGDPKVCCEKIETMFTEPAPRDLKLQPLHHISINAYITLASTYKVRMENDMLAHDFREGSNMKGFDMSRAATSYSLLLAGITNYLFSYEVSLIGTAAIFWVNAGESLLTFVTRSAWDSAMSSVNLSEMHMASPHSHFIASAGAFPAKQAEFTSTCISFLSCIRELCLKVWPILAAGFPCLKDIKDPVDFSWVGRIKDSSELRRHPDPSSEGGSCYEHILKDRKVFYQLAIYCMEYGGYLAKICYGSHCSLGSNNLVCGETPPPDR